MSFVLDASVAAAWIFPDERSGYSESMLDTVRLSGAIVPPVWHLELANIMLVAERRRRVAQAQIAHAIHFLRELPIQTVTEPTKDDMFSLLGLARETNLSAYDASYLALAIQEALPLATLDRRLRAAADRLGVGVA